MSNSLAADELSTRTLNRLVGATSAVRPALVKQTSIVNDSNPIAELFDFGEQVTRHQYGQLEFISQPSNQLSRFLYSLRIETICRLVENDKFRCW